MHGHEAESLQFDLPTSTATSCYQQQDADCGILTIANALVVAKGYNIADTIKAMDRERLNLIRYYLFFSIMKESFDSHGTANLLTLKSVFLGLDDSDLQSSGNVNTDNNRKESDGTLVEHESVQNKGKTKGRTKREAPLRKNSRVVENNNRKESDGTLVEHESGHKKERDALYINKAFVSKLREQARIIGGNRGVAYFRAANAVDALTRPLNTIEDLEGDNRVKFVGPHTKIKFLEWFPEESSISPPPKRQKLLPSQTF